MNGYARLVRQMMNQHGLTAWKINWSRAKKTHGRCFHDTRVLEFSAVAFGLIGEDEVRNTILHEIAHALAGPGHGHDSTWVRIHRSIGGTGAQYVTKEAAQTIPTAWVGKCPNGHTSGGMHRAPLRVKGCGKCSRSFTPENLFAWYQHGRRVSVSEMPQRYRAEYLGLVAKYGERVPR